MLTVNSFSFVVEILSYAGPSLMLGSLASVQFSNWASFKFTSYHFCGKHSWTMLMLIKIILLTSDNEDQCMVVWSMWLECIIMDTILLRRC